MYLNHCFSLIVIVIYISFAVYDKEVEARDLTNELSNEECVRRIYKDCNNPKTFTDEELENVRLFLNYTFMTQASIKPDKPLCNKLKVRQNWKCLTEEQKKNLIDVWKQLYKNGVIQEFSKIHKKYWPNFHITPEFVPAHRWLISQFDKKVQSIDPSLVMPYWETSPTGSQPERSSIWETFGHFGNLSNNYSVTDGFYSQINLNPPLRRHWLDNGRISPWQTPEFLTMVLQSSKTFLELIAGAAVNHFPAHLNVGGYEGQYSVGEAPYDVLFYLHHIGSFEIDVFQFQLSTKKLLTPSSPEFNIGINPKDGSHYQANLLKDNISWANESLREFYWIGFGDMCYISDVLVRPINNKWLRMNGHIIKDPKPTAAKRLPEWILKKYFPYFNSGEYSGLFHYLEEVGNCNAGPSCRPIPRPVFMSDTDNGKRIITEYGIHINYTEPVLAAERKQLRLWLDLIKANYCSPYVTTY